MGVKSWRQIIGLAVENVPAARVGMYTALLTKDCGANNCQACYVGQRIPAHLLSDRKIKSVWVSICEVGMWVEFGLMLSVWF